MHKKLSRIVSLSSFGLLLALPFACMDQAGRDASASTGVQSCMKCHNGSQHDDYAGPGLENPHPFPGADNLGCTVCHGGDASGADKESSHVPPPPQIGDRTQRETDREAWFNRLTLAGIDKYANYNYRGKTYSSIDYLQFINPGDLRVVTKQRGCGQCHQNHSERVSAGLLATEAGILAGGLAAAGVASEVAASAGRFQDTSADLGFRAVLDPDFVFDANDVGAVGQLNEFPVHSVFGVEAPDQLYRNQNVRSTDFVNQLDADKSITAGSDLERTLKECFSFACGDCHLGSAGANNRYGDFRSSGCTACHMPYSLDGRSRSLDPNVNKLEPANPDNIRPPERAHVKAHRIVSVKKTLASGVEVQGMDDYACAGCHQGSNRTVLQYWGIRLDQNQDVRRGFQYPANPVSFKTSSGDTRLFDPAVRNNTFNGRNRNQLLVFEDYDGDGRDDTPADVHYEAGMGCIDCHGSSDLHGGDVDNPSSGRIYSRMGQDLSITCESCHGTATAYAGTKSGTTYDGQTATMGVDKKGKVLRNVTKESDGNYYLTSRVTGKKHFIVQTHDVIVNTGRKNPFTQQPVYNVRASYAMGRDDNSTTTGIGPQQTGSPHAGFSHVDNMSCSSCHSAWQNNCTGCHLEGEYSTNPNNFSNITGQRIAYRLTEAQFVYQSPVQFMLGVGPDNKIQQFAPGTKMFYRYRDIARTQSQVFAFSDRNGMGNNPSASFPALGHNAIMAHSIRGRVTPQNEGVRNCVACHLTTNSVSSFGTQYSTFRTAMANNTFSSLDFSLLQTHIGKNTGNALDSPFWVHMVAGLGTGLYLFDKDGGPVNPLDANPNRYGSGGVSPASKFNLSLARFNLDRLVNSSGVSQGSNNHPMRDPTQTLNLRTGAAHPLLSGPLGSTLLQRLTDPNTGIVLNAWLDANSTLKGDAPLYVK